jgi:hypothetical protein
MTDGFFAAVAVVLSQKLELTDISYERDILDSYPNLAAFRPFRLLLGRRLLLALPSPK